MRYPLLGLLLLAACSSPTPETATSGPEVPAVADKTAPAADKSKTDEVLQSAEVSHAFSAANQPDKFRLQLRGRDVLTAQAHLSIVTAGGDTLWSERFPAADLVSYEGLPAPSAAEQQAAIRKRVDTFFQKETFTAPAIKSTAAFDPDLNGKRELWAEVKQRQLPGFNYLLGYEDGRTLAYSPRLGKAVIVRNCC